MRDLIRIVENNQSTVTLYRGDSAKVQQFEIVKTSMDALFGIGIYLTDSLEVAKDYTVKTDYASKDNQIIYRGKNDEICMSKRDLIIAYLQKIMHEELNFDVKMKILKDECQQQYYNTLDTEEKADLQTNFTLNRSKLIRSTVEKAKGIFKDRSPDIKITRLTTGEYILVKKNRMPSVSQFNIPVEYLNNCLHAEQPLSDEALKVVRQMFLATQNNDEKWKFDLRLKHNEFKNILNTFDDFIEGFKIHGSRYAWTEKKFGGKGENPSLDLLWNGTQSGYYVFGRDRSSQENLIKALASIGYNGLIYDGGKSLAGSGNRGGGGMLHKAYVMWNERELNSFRVDDITFDDEDTDNLTRNLRTKSISGYY